ncbi:hypothetical protein [Brunnivagina elsteri]|uniref:Uncharacterized protein n=1 Tax=Brunnivagina elsteri CCALA 953 TaxID=987040 RepID=A0A2A2TN42_9CYAN|nr:hypothetical protein [Calothrix elsteri]PAX59873.1 hypothetical protein CK510_04805 [Calothrix elsteri CCALA 953]
MTEENRRVQLNIRFDHRSELLDDVKNFCTVNKVKLVDFVGDALDEKLQRELTMTQVREPGTNELIAIAIAPILERLSDLEITLLNLPKNETVNNFAAVEPQKTPKSDSAQNLEQLRDRILMECQPNDRRKVKKALNQFINSLS